MTIASYKGGVSKTVCAVHLAGVLQAKGKTLLVDGDPNRSATEWAARGKGFPFTVLDEETASGRLRDFEHVVIDTQARPSDEDLGILSANCDLLVIPTSPDVLAINALMRTLQVVKGNYKVLVTMIPPRPSRAGQEVQASLKKAGWPVFKTMIPRLAAFPKAVLMGCLVKDLPDPRAQIGWAEYQALGKELRK